MSKNVFIVASCHVDRLEFCKDATDHFSAYTASPSDGCLCLVGISGVQEHDGTISRRDNAAAGNAGRHFHYKDGRFWVDQAARMLLEYVCETLVKGAA